MPRDYLAHLNDVNPRNAGLLFEQIDRAAVLSTFLLRAMGLHLPGSKDIPIKAETSQHLCRLVNEALDAYFQTQQRAPKNTRPDEVWGEADDALFSITVTGLSERVADGFTAQIEFNLLYT